MNVRRATPVDVAALAALRQASHEDAPADPSLEQRLARWLEAEGDRRASWLVEVDGEAVGTVGLLEYRRMPKPGRADECWGYVANMFVLLAHRGRGVGAALLSAVLAHADERKYVRVVLSPSERAISLYRRAGFRPAGDGLMVRE